MSFPGQLYSVAVCVQLGACCGGLQEEDQLYDGHQAEHTVEEYGGDVHAASQGDMTAAYTWGCERTEGSRNITTKCKSSDIVTRGGGYPISQDFWGKDRTTLLLICPSHEQSHRGALWDCSTI